MTLADTLDSFEAAELGALAVLGLIFGPQTLDEWDDWMQACAGAGKIQSSSRVTRAMLPALVERAVECGVVERGNDDGELCYTLSGHGLVAVLERAHALGSLGRLGKAIEKEILRGTRARHWDLWRLDEGARVTLLVAQLRVGLVADHRSKVLEATHQLFRWHHDGIGGILLAALGLAPPQRWLEMLPGEVRARFVDELTQRAWIVLDHPPSELPRWVVAFADRGLQMRAARLFALRGDSASVAALGKLPKWGSEAVELIAQFNTGDYEAAAEFGDAVVARMKRKRKRLDGPEGIIHTLVQVVTAKGNAARTLALQQSLELSADSYGHLHTLFQQFDVASRMSTRPTKPFEVFGARVLLGWLELMVYSLCLHWLGYPLKDYLSSASQWFEVWRRHATNNGYVGVAREYRALVAILAGEAPPSASLAGAYARRQPWETILDTLESVATLARASVDDEPAVFREHIVWQVEVQSRGLEIKPRLISSPRSRKGKVVSLRSLLEGKYECLSDADRRVLAVAAAQEATRYGQFVPPTLSGSLDALVALIDHPRVRGPSAEPLRITRGQVRLRTRTEAGITSVELSPRELVAVAIHAQYAASDHIEVFMRDDALASIYPLFGEAGELTIPSSGRGRLLDSLANLATATGLKIEGEGALAARTRETDSRPAMQLQWDGSTFVVEARVAPLGPEGPRLRPGQGPAEIVGRIAGQLWTCARALDDEAQRFDALLDACPTLVSQLEDEGRWEVSWLDTALEILLELDALGDAVTLHWPRGRKLGVPRQLALENMRVQVESKTNWLQVNLELATDEGRTLGFKQLLASKRDQGRFIALGDDQFLALTNELRRRLDALESLGTLKRGAVTIHPVALPLIEQLVDDPNALSTDPAARARLDRWRSIASKTPRLPRGFEATLRDYQREGYRWMARLAEAGLGAVLADDMGLGKTIQSLALLCQRSKLGPALVVAPTSVVGNWIAEAERFAPRLRCHLLSAAPDRAALLASLRSSDVVLCSYGLLVNEAEALAAIELGTLVFDEAHALKNARSKRAKAAFGLQAGFRLSLTGTPLENHLGELWSVFQATVPGLLGSQKRFEQRFVRPITEGQRERARQLRSMIQPFVLRRTKAQVLDELPARTEVTIRVTPTTDERAFYEALRRDAAERMTALGGSGAKARIRILAEITRLRQAAVDPRLVDPELGPPGAKIQALVRRLVDLREEGHRALIFTQFLGSLATVRERLDEAGIEHLGFDGSTPAKQRGEAVEAFQAGEADVFVMSLKAGGVGINLTGADYVMHLDPWWNPAVEDQATGRAHRIGQQRPVTVYRLITAGTIEEQILELHEQKRDLADDLLAGLDQAKTLDLEQLRALLGGA